jgi:hypothetical protein
VDEPRTWPFRLAEVVVRGIEAGLKSPLSSPGREHMVRATAIGAVREMCRDLPPMTDELDCDRADGRCVCRCGLEYRDHPGDPAVLSNFGEPFLTILCDGRRVKL